MSHEGRRHATTAPSGSTADGALGRDHRPALAAARLPRRDARHASRRLATAIRDMWVRGAPLIGVTAAYGVAHRHARRPLRRGPRRRLGHACTRPARPRSTCAGRSTRCSRPCSPLAARRRAPPPPTRRAAADLPTRTSAINRAIGLHGLEIIREIAARKQPGEPVNILTHCNAGWLATVDWGTATAPIYLAPSRPAFPSTSGSTRPGRATRAPSSPPGRWPATACRTR